MCNQRIRDEMTRRVAAFALLAAGGCSSPEPLRVFVPGPGFRHVVRISTARGDAPQVAVGQALVLSAVRRSGPWVAALRHTLPADACWVGQPLDEEPEVSDNLRWIAEPDGAATFNVTYRHDHTREVRFSAPGTYRLRAQSSISCSRAQESNTITILVTSR